MGSRITACVVLLLSTFLIRLGISSLDRDSGLVKTQTGRQFDDEMKVFDDEIEDFSGSVVAPTPVPAKLKKDYRFLLNSDFELTNVSGNATVLASATDNPQLIPNWFVGENGVEILQNSSYQMSNYAPSVFAIHLNNPNSVGNSTQGSIATQNLTWAPQPATLYTIQYDCARNPDGPLNLQSALRISSMSGLTVNYFTVHRTNYNLTDTRNQITWIRQSVLIMGTGAATNILFESMSEKYGPIIDNVQILIGVHILHPFISAGPPPSMLSLWLLLCPIFTLVVLMATVHSEILFFLTEAAGAL